jgi:hypothetical protein
MSGPVAAAAALPAADRACSALSSEACALAMASLASFSCADALCIKPCARSRHSLRHALTSVPRRTTASVLRPVLRRKGRT